MSALPGAIVGTETGVAEHFGSPFIEQRELQAGNAIVDLGHHGVISVSGQDRLSWLNSMTSQELRMLAPGVSTESLLLDPNGHIEYVLRIVDDGERSWILIDEHLASELCEFLNRMRFMLRVEVSDMSETHQAVGLFTGGSAEAELRSILADQPPLVLWVDPWSAVCVGGWQYATSAEHPAIDWRYAEAVVPRITLTRLAQSVAFGTIAAAGLLALNALRIAAWRPSQHSEVDDRALPHEFDWMRSAVHLEKGCYRGQETVAKVHNLGHPPRRLVMLHLDGSDAVLPTRGDLLYQVGGEKPVGRITSSARHLEWGSIALALLKRSVDSDAQLEVECDSLRIPATQEVIVPPEAGATRTVPKMPRL